MGRGCGTPPQDSTAKNFLVRPRVLAEAEAELLSATLYYEDRQRGLGQDFYERVASTMAGIAQDPLRHPVYEGKRCPRSFRRAAVGRFPYFVVYDVRADETLVIAVAHASREPGYWERRDA